MSIKTTRFSGAEWASEIHEITIIGVGGIGSWTALNLARIGHDLILFDNDLVDRTNVTGGQMFKTSDVGKLKVNAIAGTCRDFGCSENIEVMEGKFNGETTPITICAVDNMAARKEVFEAWLKEHPENSLFIDGRLTMEMFEIFCIPGGDSSRIKEYRKDHLFSDEEAQELDCTMKQSTFAAMGIASNITALLCNWLTNVKYKMDIRETPFYLRGFLPIINFDKREAKPAIVVEEAEKHKILQV